MKNIIFILIFFSSFDLCTLSAQTYFPLPDSSATWIIQQDDGGPGQDYYHKFFTYTNKNDTLINGNNYIKLFQSFFSFLDTNYAGAYRSDTTGKTFFIPADSTQELLLRDFSKIPTDTVFSLLYSPAPGFTYYILIDMKVDSVNYVSCGPYLLKRMYLSGSSIVCPPVVWIEKIGCLSGGVLNTQTCSLGYIFLNCMSSNDTVFYSNTIPWNLPDPVYVYGNCGITGIVENEKLKIEVFPNPFSESISIRFPSPVKKYHLKFYDSLGLIVFEEQITGENTIINLKQLNSALYCLYIADAENKILLTKKLLKQ